MKHPAFHDPPTKRMDLVEEQFGVKVADPYRWLENDVRQDNEVRAWIDAENAVTQTYLQTLPGRNILRKRMAALLDHDRYGTPRKAGSQIGRASGRERECQYGEIPVVAGNLK